VRQTVKKQVLFGVKVGGNGIVINILQFANDTLFIV